MKKISIKITIYALLFATLAGLNSVNLYANEIINFKDSVGVKTIAGKKFIVHKIERGESFYSIAKKYHVTVKELEDANPDLTGTIIAGKILFVPYTEKYVEDDVPPPPIIVKKKVVDSDNNKPKPIDTVKKTEVPPIEIVRTQKTDTVKVAKNTVAVSTPIRYVVQSGDNLGYIAIKYQTYVSWIMKWNNLTSDRINIGQVLIVGYTTTEENTNHAKTDGSKTDTVTVKRADDAQSYSNDYVKFQASNKPMKDFQEKGVAAWIDDQDVNPKKYFALHRTAPIGTIIKVTNPMNNRYVFVKVVGTLPDTGDNANIIIKISKASASKLDILDAHFQCILDFATNIY